MGAFGISLDGGNTWDFSYSQGIPEDAIPVKMSVKKIDNTQEYNKIKTEINKILLTVKNESEKID